MRAGSGNFLGGSYLAKAGDQYAFMYIKGGKELYGYLFQSTTTLPLTPGGNPPDGG